MKARPKKRTIISCPIAQQHLIQAWMENRGMGFIAPSDGSADLFVHRSYLQDGGAVIFLVDQQISGV